MFLSLPTFPSFLSFVHPSSSPCSFFPWLLLIIYSSFVHFFCHFPVPFLPFLPVPRLFPSLLLGRWVRVEERLFLQHGIVRLRPSRTYRSGYQIRPQVCDGIALFLATVHVYLILLRLSTWWYKAQQVLWSQMGHKIHSDSLRLRRILLIVPRNLSNSF